MPPGARHAACAPGLIWIPIGRSPRQKQPAAAGLPPGRMRATALPCCGSNGRKAQMQQMVQTVQTHLPTHPLVQMPIQTSVPTPVSTPMHRSAHPQNMATLRRAHAPQPRRMAQFRLRPVQQWLAAFKPLPCLRAEQPSGDGCKSMRARCLICLTCRQRTAANKSHSANCCPLVQTAAPAC